MLNPCNPIEIITNWKSKFLPGQQNGILRAFDESDHLTKFIEPAVIHFGLCLEYSEEASLERVGRVSDSLVYICVIQLGLYIIPDFFLT